MVGRCLSVLIACAVIFPAFPETGSVLFAQEAPVQSPARIAEPATQEPSVEAASEPAAPAVAALKSEQLLPHSTQAFVSLPDLVKFNEHFQSTEIGQMVNDPLLKEFIDALKSQAQGWLNEKNVRLGAKIEDLQEFQTGEICLAGILQRAPGQQNLNAGSHGMVLLVDIKGNEEEARKLLGKIDNEFESRQAVRGEKDINGNIVTEWTVKRENKLVDRRTTYYVLAGGWVLASDNEAIFREVLLRLSNPENIKEEETLASQKSFQTVFEQTKTGDIHTDIRWFIDPFGYLEFAQAIDAEEQKFRQQRQKWVQDFRDQGFDALGAVGGRISFATTDHEILHRTFVYAPSKQTVNAKQQRVFNLIDFENKEQRDLDPPAWVGEDSAFYSTGIWDMSKALENVGYFVDMKAGEGAWDEALKGFKVEAGVDVPAWVEQFDDRVIITSRTEKPVSESSERVKIFLPLRNKDGMLDKVAVIVGGGAKKINLIGEPVLEIDNTPKAELDDPVPNIFSGGDDVDEDEDEDGNVSEDFKLFEKCYIAVHQEQLVIANDKELMKEILSGNQTPPLAQSQDYIRVKEALGQLTDETRISFRQFGRIDRILETNYEMLRLGKMGDSKTILARMLNRTMNGQDQDPNTREQKLDGSKLPADFDAAVGKYFGPSGAVMETMDDGWRFTGCLLKKKPVNEMVQKSDDANRQR